MAVSLTAGRNLRQNLNGYSEVPQNALVPLQRGKTHQLRATGVGNIRDVNAATDAASQFQIRKLSTVPQIRSPASACARAPGTFSRIQRILRPLK